MINSIISVGSVSSSLLISLFKVIICLGFSSSWSAFAHGPGLEKINSITTQMVEQGYSPELYVKRAHILQDNQHWQEAMSDFNKAADLDPLNAELDLYRARLSYDSSEYLRALDFIKLYLLRHQNTTEAMLIKARSYRALAQYKKAVEPYQIALADLSAIDGRPSPEWYVEFAETLIMTGDKHNALLVLQQGMDKLGITSVFQLKAAELEAELGFYDSALKRIEQISSQSQRKDIWLSRRADILSMAGQKDEALEVYQQAYVALQQLPQRLRKLPVTRHLERNLQEHLVKQ